MSFKSVAGVILITVILLLIIETICYTIVDDTSFLWDFSSVSFFASSSVDDPKWGFNEIDPLLGYSKTEEKLKKEGFTIEKSCIVLFDNNDTGKLVNILITGGSTSDLSLYAGCWPVELHKILKSNGIHAKLYCAGVGGYNSGQELLKLIRDGVKTRPFIHISYSGANESVFKSYISNFEQDFFEAKLKQDKGNTSWLMPSTVTYFRNLLKLNHPDIHLRPTDNVPGAEFWEENMRLMHGVAMEHNYHFIGLLQPVLGGGKFNQKMTGHDHDMAIKEYQDQYPKMKELAGRYPDFVTDLSAIFDTCHGAVFIDNCHIREEYQHLVAENVYNVLVQRKLLK